MRSTMYKWKGEGEGEPLGRTVEETVLPLKMATRRNAPCRVYVEKWSKTLIELRILTKSNRTVIRKTFGTIVRWLSGKMFGVAECLVNWKPKSWQDARRTDQSSGGSHPTPCRVTVAYVTIILAMITILQPRMRNKKLFYRVIRGAAHQSARNTHRGWPDYLFSVVLISYHATVRVYTPCYLLIQHAGK